MSLARQLVKDARFALGVLRKRPFQVLVQVTNRCNMRCSFCDFWPNPAPPSEELSVDDHRRLARELSEIGCFLVSIEGGEPFARPDLVEIVEAYGKDHIPILYTNGWFVTEGNARALFDAGLVHACVSIDYPDAARHDAKRGLEGAFSRAWKAVDVLREVSPRKEKQVHVMTVLMESNWRDLDALLSMSAAHRVGHQVTMLSTAGHRRGRSLVDRVPPPEAARAWIASWESHGHLQFFRDYFSTMEDFLRGEPMPTCRAGLQSFNVDHVGDVSPCIEKIDRVFGNVKRESIADIHRKLVEGHGEIARCQDCWTACRGFNQALGDGGSARGWIELATRMRSS